MHLRVNKVIRETSDAVSIHFNNSGFFSKVKYKPGQFLTLCLKINGQLEKRAYSLSSSPVIDKDLVVTVKRVEKGMVSNYINDNIQTGTKLKVEAPRGEFTLEPASSKRNLIFFAAGSGITPVYSIIKTALAQETETQMTLFYANRNVDSIIFKKELLELEAKSKGQFNIVHILEEGSLNHSYNGFLTPEVVSQSFEILNTRYIGANYYMCGPAGFMDKAKDILLDKGVDRSKIKQEIFTLPAVKPSGKTILSDVTVRKGKELFNLKVKSNKTILQSFMASNQPIPHSCRAGQCSTCKAKIVEGEVEMIKGHLLPEEEIAKGYCLMCVGFPKSEKVTLEIA